MGKQHDGVSVNQQQFKREHVEAQNLMDNVESCGNEPSATGKTDEHKVDY